MASSDEWKNWPMFVQRRAALDKADFTNATTVVSQSLPANHTIAAKMVIEWLYSVLTTLDAKASALMRLNGVLIAAAAFLLGLFGRPGGVDFIDDKRKCHNYCFIRTAISGFNHPLLVCGKC